MSSSSREFRHAFQIETRVRNAIHTLPIAVVQTDQNGMVLWAEDLGLKAQNKNLGFMVGHSIWQLFAEQTNSMLEELQADRVFYEVLVIENTKLGILAQGKKSNTKLESILFVATFLGYVQTDMALQNKKPLSIHQGRLDEIGGVSAVLQLLATIKSTGCLELDSAKIYLEQGFIVAAEHPALTGQDAVIAISKRTHGQFVFHIAIRAAEANLKLTMQEIILTDWYNGKTSAAPMPVNPSENLIILPNATATLAFINGVGGREAFTISTAYVPELQAECVVLVGKGFRIIVLSAQKSDFLESP